MLVSSWSAAWRAMIVQFVLLKYEILNESSGRQYYEESLKECSNPRLVDRPYRYFWFGEPMLDMREGSCD